MPILIPVQGSPLYHEGNLRAEDYVSEALDVSGKDYTYRMGTNGSAWFSTGTGPVNATATRRFARVSADGSFTFKGVVLRLSRKEFEQRLARSSEASDKHYASLHRHHGHYGF